MAKKSPQAPVLVLRTCDKDLRSYNGFQWKAKGIVKAPDWDPRPECGNGLHGFLWGEGDGSLADFDPAAKWLVVEVEEYVDLQGKVKFPRGKVVHCGDRLSATAYMVERAPGRAVVGASIAAGDSGTATAGDRGTATAGDSGTATAGDRGTATAGYGGTATAGYGGTATAGYRGTIQIRWWDGNRYRTAVGDVGENGIEADVPYHVVAGRLVRK